MILVDIHLVMKMRWKIWAFSELETLILGFDYYSFCVPSSELDWSSMDWWVNFLVFYDDYEYNSNYKPITTIINFFKFFLLAFFEAYTSPHKGKMPWGPISRLKTLF